ncbi:RNA-binding protein, putative [Trypanosoma equiperdum]|uniref:RRM domain-containing protein n=4 Tax=Trypanozoon TaxID=39700 RepID=Q57WR1_TRYB2|nr:hypothetical protein, conserved [Trypanosoma brucei gambiense DAL972]XP_845763.1 hypothetical protein, conserved [Trypanosoma brucei brucei TREU927]AAX69931.1 hypothetical protein, conserved [Trypanosoma brucei]RHW71513.1 RNA-binding protein [Trypanosoma brucei equiperdum]SCU71937.1 RNA-binding protein, putative [Trypanosoma equiperdum]AAZ12204.1 hypothetical protein, conserved [Trypanosoma brucei brucei TREU927]CBH12163.1 hypothetical protein, conserved [Trypanosoma brucei gambiense DAL97|eukprot:XP_011774446.1 hypothetical protein, conserved [Trypanosoma brucei gambiense DAL972]
MTVNIVARISNLPTSITDAHLRELIEPFARVRCIIMPKSALWQTCPTGRAEVVGATTDDTILVYVHLHGSIIDGNRVNVSFGKVAKCVQPTSSSRFAGERRERTSRRTRSESRGARKRPKRGDRSGEYCSRGHGKRQTVRRSPTPRKTRRYSTSPSSRSSSSGRDSWSSDRSRSRSRSPYPSWS